MKPKPFYLVNYRNDTPEKRQATVEIAKHFVKDFAEIIRFDIVRRNCEHFATYCRTGNWESKQVEKLIDELLVPVVNVVSTSIGSSVGINLG
jgi:hypothetical protein